MYSDDIPGRDQQSPESVPSWDPVSVHANERLGWANARRDAAHETGIGRVRQQTPIDSDHATRAMHTLGEGGMDAGRPVPPAPVPTVNALQDEVMAAESAEGRPTPKPVRHTEWAWGVAAAVVILGVTGAIVLASGVSAWVVFVGMVVALLAAAAPAWGAGLLRAGEERQARDHAKDALGVPHADKAK